MSKQLFLMLIAAVSLLLPFVANAAELLLPQNRNAYFSEEAIELAVAGLEKGATANLEIVSANPASLPLACQVTGDGSTVTAVLPPYALAPGKYTLKLDGKAAGALTVSSGVWQSTMPVSQTARGWSNFIVSNAFSMGLLDGKGLPLQDVRGKKSGTLASFEKAIADNIPLLCYMYWTGYVTHKPFGGEKSWANADMQQAMRLLSFSTAQRLRKFDKAFLSIGCLDEPGLSWGPTPAGGMASGFPNWDEKPWYDARGWKYTDNVGAQSDADWMKYMQVRCGILGESFDIAKKDIKTSWPQAVFSTDAYALHAIMDGTDSLNQLPNDIPSSHVFFDFFGGPMSVPGQIQLEKAAIPQSKLAHAMNGQLWGERGPQRPLYNLLMNGMLQGGIHSNWWLNTGGMSEPDIEAVNKPAAAMGPLFQEAELKGYDVAVLWSYTEIAMREKEIAQKEATKKAGQQITLMLPLPDANEVKEFSIDTNAYEVGQRYTDPVLGVHQVLRRAGYPAQIIDERLIPKGVLKGYKVLVIMGQTFAMPKPVMDSIAAFVKAGGKVVVDKSTTVQFPNAVVFAADYSANAFRAHDYKIDQLMKKAKAAGDAREESRLMTIEVSRNALFRQGVALMKAALAQTAVQPVVVTDAEDLSVDRQLIGQGMLISVLNGHDELVQIPADAKYPRYNPAPYKTSYSLQGIKPGSVVYGIEGLDWKTARRLDDPSANISADFAPGEMKLYLVAPRDPKGLKASAKLVNNRLELSVMLDVKMPWPISVTVKGPDGKPLYNVMRSTGKDGQYAEAFPLGANAPVGAYNAVVESIPGGFAAEAQVTVTPAAPTPAFITGNARVFDEAGIRAFLAKKPTLVIAIASEASRPVAEQMTNALRAKGIKAEIKPEKEVLAIVPYPRVWNPTATLYTPGGAPKAPTGEVKVKITVSTAADGTITMTDDAGKAVTDFKQANALVTIGDGGYLDWMGNNEVAYEKGCQLYIDDKRKMTVINAVAKNVPTTAEFKARWAKPWTQLYSHVGGYQLPPQTPEGYTTNSHLVVMGDSTSSQIARVLQASEMLPQTADAKYPGPGKALVEFLWSPFAVEKNVIFIGAGDADGIQAGADALVKLVK